MGGVGITERRVAGCEVYPRVLVRLGRSIDDLRDITQVNRDTVDDIDHEGFKFVNAADKITAFQNNGFIIENPLIDGLQNVGDFQGIENIRCRGAACTHTLRIDQDPDGTWPAAYNVDFTGFVDAL